MKPLSLLSLLFIAMIFSGCSCNKDPFPSPNTTGNQLSCKINGQTWTTTQVNGGLFLSSSDSHKYLYIYSYLGNESIEIYVNGPFSAGTKFFNENTQSQFYTAYPKNYGSKLSGNQVWITSATDTGSCNFTILDTAAHKFKGTFSFKARNPSTNEVIDITDGYFERSY